MQTTWHFQCWRSSCYITRWAKKFIPRFLYNIINNTTSGNFFQLSQINIISISSKEPSNRPPNNTGRRTSSTSITSESVKKARQVYCAKQPKPRYYSAGITSSGNQGKPSHGSSNSSSLTSLRCGSGGDQEGDETSNSIQVSKQEVSNENSNQQSTISNNHSRTMSLSPMKRNNNKNSKSPNTVLHKGHQSLRNGGPKIAKPVIKPQLKIPATNSNKITGATSHRRPEQSNKKEPGYSKNSRLPIPPSSSSISSGAASPSTTNASISPPLGTNTKNKPASMMMSRIPQPGNSQSPLKKSRIPSAPKYNPPQRKVFEEISGETIQTPSPPPPPPPSEMMHQDEGKLSSSIAIGRCSPSSTPTPTPP